MLTAESHHHSPAVGALVIKMPITVCPELKQFAGH